jgi:2-C-methyl-D-erythritol 2,4-cyclodiphosphate synthase
VSRTGIGIDSHAFAPGRRLVLGGVEIPHDQGRHDPSAADVLAHAIIHEIGRESRSERVAKSVELRVGKESSKKNQHRNTT